MRNREIAVLGLVSIMCLFSSFAAASQRDYSRGILNRGQVLDAAAEVTEQTYPDADRVHVDDFTLCEYQPNGTAMTWSDNYTKILTERGRRQRRNLSFEFSLPYTYVAIKMLEIIRPNGSATVVDIERQARIMTDRSQMSSSTYNPDHKVLQVGVPDVQVGDIVHLVTCHETRKRRMPNTWDDYQVFESAAPIKHAVYEVHAPRERPLCRMALKDPVQGTVQYREHRSGNRTIHRWEVSNVPRFHRELGMPPSYTVVQRLLVSTLRDWASISSWYWQVCEPHLAAVTPEMRVAVAELTEGVSDPKMRIEKIFYWVARQVRHVGIMAETEVPGWEPNDARMTFEKRNGVCRDKAVLLAAMLRLAGFEAYPVLIDTGPQKDGDVPIVFFNHVVTAVRHADGSYLLMDCSDEKSKDLLPSSLCNRSYLVACPTGESLLTTPVVPAEENMVLVDTAAEVNSAGTLVAETEVLFHGINDNLYRRRFAKMKSEERRSYVESLLKRVIPTATLKAFNIQPADALDMSKILSLRMSYSAPDFLITGGDTTMMAPPHIGTEVGLANYFMHHIRLKERRFPLTVLSTFGVRETFRLGIDQALGAITSLPDSTSIEGSTLSWYRRLERQANSISGESEFRVGAVTVDPREYLRLTQDVKQIEHERRKMVILTRQPASSPPNADAIVLEHNVEYDLVDAHNWTERHYVRKKILNNEGKKKSAELRVDYNPVWENVNLTRATVSNDERIHGISKEEIRTMDAAWVASAPRYPAGKTLVVNLPAVEVGSVVEYEYLLVKRNQPFFAATRVFRRFDPIDQQTVRLRAPASLALQCVSDDNGIVVSDPEPASKGNGVIREEMELEGDRILAQWKVQSQPAVEREESLPPLHTFCPVLRVTTGDWQVYGEEMLAAIRGVAKPQLAVEQRAREVTRGAKTRREKVLAIRDFVVKNIRAVGPSCCELPLDQVTAADQVLSDGYGNATDRAILLHAMLGAVGLDSEFVLVSSSPPVEHLKQFETRFPGANVFDKLLIRVRDGATDIYLNDTDQYAVLGSTPACGHLAMSLSDGRIETLSVPRDRRDFVSCEYQFFLTEQGDVRITVEQTTYGELFAQRRKLFAEMLPEQRSHYYQQLAAELSHSARPVGEVKTDFKSYPGVESFSVQVEKFAVRDGDLLYFELPVLLSGLFHVQSERRTNPFYYSQGQHIRSFGTIELPQEFSKVALAPGDKEWLLPTQSGRLSLQVAIQRRENGRPVSLAFSQDVDVDPFILQTGRHTELHDIDRQLSHPRGRTFLLARRDKGNDSVDSK